jgi:hypothetical protein
MLSTHRLAGLPDGNDPQRTAIRIDFPPRQAGIAAALRRAFSGAQDAPRVEEFDELLSRLN